MASFIARFEVWHHQKQNFTVSKTAVSRSLQPQRLLNQGGLFIGMRFFITNSVWLCNFAQGQSTVPCYGSKQYQCLQCRIHSFHLEAHRCCCLVLLPPFTNRYVGAFVWLQLYRSSALYRIYSRTHAAPIAMNSAYLSRKRSKQQSNRSIQLVCHDSKSGRVHALMEISMNKYLQLCNFAQALFIVPYYSF